MDKKLILNYIKTAKAKSFIEIAKHFKIHPKDNKTLTLTLSELQSEYLIFKNNKDQYYAPELKETIQGVLNVSAKGNFGFVDYNIDEENNTKDSVYVRSFNFNSAINGDLVQVNVYGSSDDTELNHGVITNVIERNNQTVIGFIKDKNATKYFVPVDNRFKSVKFRLVASLVPTKLNDLVMADILAYENSTVSISVSRVITNEADPMVFVKAYLEKVKAPHGFPEELTEEIANIPTTIDTEDQSNRRDLTNQMIVTIDGDDTKDFDDAITVKKLANGNYFLGVYIADVSHYVKEDTLINAEALNRGTSIYLVDRVIPMLPEQLSNGICSLNPNEKRFVIACEMEINSKGENVKIDIFQGIIESKYRLTYKQVDQYFNNQTELLPKAYSDTELTSMLDQAKELSQILHDFKINQGYVDFEIDEPKIKLDENGSVERIIIHQRGFSEVLIEDFMVRANETVAKYLFDKKLPVLYRVHEKPDELKLEGLKNSLGAIGISTKELNPNTINPNKFADFVKHVKLDRDDDFVKLMFLRSMQKAVYSDHNIGHFGLASEFYCHFTSPIRRYPDLIIHRIIRNFLINKDKSHLAEFKEILPTFGDLNTRSEQKAVQIERSVNDLKFAEFLKNQVGKTFKAQILSILNFGFFVEFDFKASGLVHKSTLIDAEYTANETLTKLVSDKRTFTIGDWVEVVVLGVDLVEGKVECVLSDLYQKYVEQKFQEESKRKNASNKK
ncbi:ribonuclease R [Mycoplasma nasistruthionis]|uniref:Ribonuclease R n=1 Tax=Mycoplasma nasistruthionis TaxID=353852 RepID=A0A5B7XVH9_9MOLU|nr:ribonuclease R [Mycoplasma nasistruthionis]QCZ36474.1 ribonuclease R [Mycoplasma nasistruthionis]